MTSVFRRVGRQSLIYLLGVVVNRLTGFLMLPIYTSYLSTADYGILELLSVTVEVIGMIGLLGLSAGVLKFHAEYDDPDDKREVLSTAATGIMALALLVTAVGLIASNALSSVVLGPEGRASYFRMFFVIYLLQQWEIVPLLLLRLEDRAWAFVGVGFAKLLAMLSLNIWLVVYEGKGVQGVLTANIVASAFTSVFLVAYLFRRTGIRCSRGKLKRMVRYGAPMVLWFLGNFVLVFSDRYFLRAFWGVGVVGIYSLGYRFVTLLSSLVFAPFQNVWDPERFRLAKLGAEDPEARETFRRIFTYMNLGQAFVAMGIALFTREVLLVMAADEFHDAYRVVPWLLAAQVFHHWVPYANLGLLLRERTDVLGKVAVLAVSAMLVANFLLVPPFGLYGAAIATLLAYGLRFGMVLFLSQKHFHIDYDWSRVAATYGVVIGVVMLRFSVPDLAVVPGVLFGMALTAVAAVIFFYFLLSSAERGFIQRRLAAVASGRTPAG